ncbi:pyridoxal kinase [Oratosquilla oratoria]|uniref:pyridoxal kinase n=1 Tax=Oratosquilla oratoria TaxID=337810 RepID=UPI003F75957D
MASNTVRVLSIQSHVVSGYVGNKSACFPLQVLGFEVDTINSVQFSNHTGYSHFKGQVLNATELRDLISGLKLNGLDRYTHLLTGYIGSDSFLEVVQEVVKHLKEVNPKLIYVCDPVMGDEGKMYVPKSLLPIYREKIIPLADIVTPNQFEAELLSERKISSKADVIEVMDWFHSKSVQTVVLSSTDLGSDTTLLGMASSVKGDKIRLEIDIPRFSATFTGTGDLFAALLLGWMYKTDNNLPESVENTVATMQKVLHRTLDHARSLASDKPITAVHKELRLIQSLDDIRNPVPIVKAVVL